jgi:hypothetical protein
MSAPASVWSLSIDAQMLLLGHIALVFDLRPVAGQVISSFFGPTFNSDPERGDEHRRLHAQVGAVGRVGAYRTLLGLVFRRR